jgi:hypothetical protein
MGFGTPVPRPYLGAELGPSNSFDNFFNPRSPLHGPCNVATALHEAQATFDKCRHRLPPN